MYQKRINEYGITVGRLPRGPRNKITDVAGVLVGHKTIDNEQNKTGVTVIIPAPGNVYDQKLPAAAFVWNGYGKTAGLMQIDELGVLETPIALTNTMNVGLVWDGLVEYAARQCAQDDIDLYSLNPVVGECNDSRINNILHRAVQPQDVLEAVESASADFEEGAVGAGRGTICHGLKGGVGSASRVVMLDGKKYTLGVLVQSNHGKLEDLTVDGMRLGEGLTVRDLGVTANRGSTIIVMATDLPCSPRQLGRILRRASVGLARLGSYVAHGSGEVMIGFTTARRIPNRPTSDILPSQEMNEIRLDLAFRAIAEATEEAVLNSMVCADPCKRLDGEIVHSLKEFL